MDKQLRQRLILIGAVLAMGLYLVIPPSKKLQAGIDINGGVSMIFEIEQDATDKANPRLAEDMISLLKKRVDPRGIYNLNWRPVGNTRIEVQMPLPAPENATLREAYSKASEKLSEAVVNRGKLDALFSLPADQREAAIGKLSMGSPRRADLIRTAAARRDEYVARKSGAPQPAASTSSAPESQAVDPKVALRDAEESMEDSIDAVLEANFDEQAFRDALEMDKKSKARDASLEAFQAKYPELKDTLAGVIQKFDAWREKRVYLEGPADLRRLLRGSGVLEFRILTDPAPENPTKFDRLRKQLQERGPRPEKDDTDGWFRIDNPTGFFGLNSQTELAKFEPRTVQLPYVAERRGNDFYVLSHLETDYGLLAHKEGGLPWKLLHAGVSRDERGRLCVVFELDKLGGDQFYTLTSHNVAKQLCIMVDGIAYSSANINSPIRTRGQIVGDFSQEKIEYLIQTMQAGVLPAKLKDTPLSERTIGSSLGAANLKNALNSGLIGAALVLAVMGGYYLSSGVIAYAAMAFNVLLTLAMMSMLNARFTLDGIAGVILSIGMAVDANVLIYERMREEKERGSSLRLIIKNGYDKALTVILDSNLTTLLTCIILYYVGSEEVKGFGLTLGWGVVLNLFTSVFVTRTIFTLLIKYNVIKEIRMFKLIGTPNIDWWGMRRFFIPASLIVTIAGLVLMGIRNPRDYLDIEFMGGVDAEVQLKQKGLNDVTIAKSLSDAGTAITADAKKLANANVDPVNEQLDMYRVSAAGVPAARLVSMIAEPIDEQNLMEKGGLNANAGPDAITIRLKAGKTRDDLLNAVKKAGQDAVKAGEELGVAKVGAVISNDPNTNGLLWDVTTVVTNKRLVQHALATALGDQLRTEPSLAGGEAAAVFPISDRRLESVVPGLPPGAAADVTDYLEGAAIYVPHIDPPQTLDSLSERIKNMRLQPDFANLPVRLPRVIPVSTRGADVDGKPLVDSFAVVVADPRIAYRDGAEAWRNDLADKELGLVRAALANEQSLRRVTQFKPQIAAQATTRASLALVLSWIMIIAYLWVRFGQVRYGTAGVVALIHDVLVALAFVGFSGMIPAALGAPLLIEDFRINMTVIAALLTIIGYSVNDTIVVFDRIRELRGRLGIVTPELVNRAINETLSRTVLTVFTVFVVLVAMYIWGGSSIRGFNYCMLVGVLTGCYSSIAVASPLLLFGAKRAAARN